MNKYDDIINLPHHNSLYHKRMTLEQRSKQFAPFSALTGYDEIIKEKRRITDNKISLSIDDENELNNKFLYLKNNYNTTISITYFIKDLKKDGGCYIKIKSKIKKIDDVNKIITLENNKKIDIKDIIKIEY